MFSWSPLRLPDTFVRLGRRDTGEMLCRLSR
ncbi:hypothetical protein J2X68_007419 [Streptomyces sp. 3330]|nr:hypothetical protein [Streptomyces sp. 3330]